MALLITPSLSQKCFTSNSELRSAVRDYEQDPTANSVVADIYGFPIDNWCVDGISNFSFVFQDSRLNPSLTNWDTSYAKEYVLLRLILYIDKGNSHRTPLATA